MVLAALGVVLGCNDEESASSAAIAGSASAPQLAASVHAAPISTMKVDHGELDTLAPADASKLAATVIATTVYKLPNVDSRKLGYLRLGGRVKRDADPVSGKGCKTEWYRVYPMGYVCTDEATIKMDDPLVRATDKRPDLNKPLPYKYGFVRATAPQYLRIPTKEQQLKSEFKLEEHLKWFEGNRNEVQRVDLGANDVPLDDRGIPRHGLAHAVGFRLSTQLSLDELFGAEKPNNDPPFWLDGNDRQIPNVSGFIVPDYAIFADRVRRKTGLSFIDAFGAESEGLKRRFAVTVDMRLVPTTKVKPDTGSTYHGIEIPEGLEMPFAWVLGRDVKMYETSGDGVREVGDVPRRALIPLTGKAAIKDKHRYYQSAKDTSVWLAARDLGIVAEPPEWPEFAAAGEKWMDVSLKQQTMVLYEGKKPWYATLVSTGRDRLGDPEESLATPQGEFRLQSKHIAAAMDSEGNSTVAGGTRANTGRTGLSASALATVERLRAAEKAGRQLSDKDQRRLENIKKGRHPEYGVTIRRGAAGFELRDVPWIQYFASGYAVHGAYWHDVFGIPRSHGCINLAPIDARIAFMWTDPPIPDGWHGINIGPDMGEGTGIYIHE